MGLQRALNTVSVSLALGLVALAAWHTQNPPNTDGQSALENTGSGGGAAGYSPSSKSTAGSRGSGIVLIAYPT